MSVYILFSTSWSAQNGGINAINYDLASALNANAQEIFAIVSDATDSDISDAARLGVQLRVASSDYSNLHNWLPALLEDLRPSLNGECLWIGHDTITGGAALLARNIVGGKFVLFHHMDYANYYHLKKKNGEEKISSQKSLLKQADVVFGVGPRLFANAKRLRLSAKQTYLFEPGRPSFAIAASKEFDRRIAICGRLSASEDPVKNLSASIRAAVSSINNEGNRGALTLIGAEYGSARNIIGKNLPAIAVNEISYIGNRENYYSEVIDNNIVMMPSVKEGFGLVGWEALCLGIPLVLSRSCGLYEWLKANNLSEYVVSVEMTGIAPFDEMALKGALSALIGNYKDHKSRALELANSSKIKTWNETAIHFASLLSSEVPKPREEKSDPIPVKKADKPKLGFIDKDNPDGSFERFEDLLSISCKKRQLVIPIDESTDYSKGKKVKYEFWRGWAPAEQYFLYINPYASLTQTIQALAESMSRHKIFSKSIYIIRRDKSASGYLRRLFDENGIKAEIFENTIKEYIWDFCIDGDFKCAIDSETLTNYVDQSLLAYDGSTSQSETSARIFLSEKLSSPPEHAAILIEAAGGMGKTWLCRSLAEDLQRKLGPNGLVVLIQAEILRAHLVEVGIGQVEVRSLYELYLLYGRAVQDTRSFDRATFDLAVISGNIVIIVDGLDELATVLQAQFDVADFLTSVNDLSMSLKSSQVLITTRNSLIAEDFDLDKYRIKRHQLLGFSSKDLEAYASKRFRQRSTKKELSLKLIRILFSAGLSGPEHRVIPFLADVVGNILEDEADKKDDPDFEFVDEETPYRSNNEIIDNIIHSIFRREVRRQDIRVDLSDLVLFLAEVASLHGRHFDLATLHHQLSLYFYERASELQRKIILNPLFIIEGVGISFRYDFLQPYFRALYVIECIEKERSDFDALDALAKTNINNCPELDYVRKFYSKNPDGYDQILPRLIKKISSAIREGEELKSSTPKKSETARRALSAVVKIYSEVRACNSSRFSEKMIELFSPSSSMRCIDGMHLYGDFPSLDLSGVTIINSKFSEHKNFPMSKVKGAKFTYCTFERCADGEMVDKSFGSADFDSTCELGDIDRLIQSAKAKSTVSMQLAESEALIFVKSFYKLGGLYPNDPKRSWIAFSNKVPGLKNQNFESLIPEYVCVKIKKADETYYQLTKDFSKSAKDFIDNNKKDNMFRKFLKLIM